MELTKIDKPSKSYVNWLIAVLVALFISVPAWANTRALGIPQSLQQMQTVRPECGTSDFTFHDLRAQPAGYGFTRITGRISNNCSEAKGAEIKITTYNRAGDILSENDIWPASINNIPPNSEFPFEWLHTKVALAKFTVTIISVKSWTETLAQRFPLDGETANTLTPSN